MYYITVDDHYIEDLPIDRNLSETELHQMTRRWATWKGIYWSKGIEIHRKMTDDVVVQ